MDFQLSCFEVVDSTMELARALADAGCAQGRVVQADCQSAGRGRFGNVWQSPKGNVYMSVVLRPPQNGAPVAQLSFVMAVALAEALEALGVPYDDIGLKWPNDVLVGGQKIAGILLEQHGGHRAPYLIVGMGINVEIAPEGAQKITAYNAAVRIDAVRDAVLQALGTHYGGWCENGFADARARWLAQGYGIGCRVKARMAKRTEYGVFEALDEQGNLLLRDNGGNLVTINSAAVQFE